MSDITCWRLLLEKGAEFYEPPQPLHGSVAQLLPDDLQYLCHSLLQPLPQLLQQCMRQGQLSAMHLRHGATAGEGQDGEGRGVHESYQQGFAGGQAY